MEARPPLVMIVDDEEGFRLGAVVALRRGGFRVAAAADGGEAIERILSSRDAGDPVRLVVTDICMPVMSGLELIDTMREHGIEALVCAITCFGDHRLVSALMEKGCTECLEKPFLPEALVDRVREMLGAGSP